LDELTSANSVDENSEQTIEKLLGYKVSGKMDKRLLLNIERIESNKEPKS